MIIDGVDNGKVTGAHGGGCDRQPRCIPSVCNRLCSYRDCRWVVDAIDLGRTDAVVLSRDRGGSVLSGCVVMYLNRKCGPLEAIKGRELSYMWRHSPYLMNECPLRAEHLVHDWSRRRG